MNAYKLVSVRYRNNTPVLASLIMGAKGAGRVYRLGEKVYPHFKATEKGYHLCVFTDIISAHRFADTVAQRYAPFELWSCKTGRRRKKPRFVGGRPSIISAQLIVLSSPYLYVNREWPPGTAMVEWLSLTERIYRYAHISEKWIPSAGH